MKKSPTIYKLFNLMREVDRRDNVVMIKTDPHSHTYVPARPEGKHSWFQRCKAAWLVFTGNADAVIWPGNQ